MKYSPSAYAEAFLSSIDGGSPEETAIARLSELLLKNGDKARAAQVLHEVEKALALRKGGKMIRAEFAREVDTHLRDKILSRYGEKDRVSVAINPHLLAGVRIITDGESELDVSLRGKLQSVLG